MRSSEFDPGGSHPHPQAFISIKFTAKPMLFCSESVVNRSLQRTVWDLVSGELPAQPDALDGLLRAHPGGDLLSNEPVCIGMQTLSEQGLHLGLGYLALNAESGGAASHPLAWRCS